MTDIILPADAFSHSQIRSKLWLTEQFKKWEAQHLTKTQFFTLNWYGSWVGIGPLILLTQSETKFNRINLYDLNSTDLESSKKLLDYWRCQSIEINLYAQDINTIVPSLLPNQIYINTSCEHLNNYSWVENINQNSYVLLQSTNMPHELHINCPKDLSDFKHKYEPFLNIIDAQQIYFDYPDKKFYRFMLFGTRK